MRSTAPRYQHIAAGALVNARGEVLVCQRPAHKLYPGEWEFPGGKVEAGEHVEDALRRELREELGIGVIAARPLICLRFSYPELSVELDAWLVTDWDGEPVSTEHPATAWVAPDALPHWKLLAADRPIVNALRLPAQCVFSPEALDDKRLARPLDAFPPRALLRLRLPGASDPDYRAAAERWCAELGGGARLVLDRDPLDVVALGAGGFHARSPVLRRLRARPVPADKWFGASCHDAEELALARAFGADYAVLGPVKATGTHPDATPLGWLGFERLARGASLPVYAIGGLGPQDLADAWRHGAQGVAGISAYWRGLPAGGGSAGASGPGSAGIA